MRYRNFFREMDQLQREMEGLFNGTVFSRPAIRINHSDGRQYPKINLREDADNVYLEALLPGVDPKSLEISVLGNVLSLSGEREMPELGEGAAWHKRERHYGRFSKDVELPADVDLEQVKAESRHGLLRVTLPKLAVAKPQKITVTVS